MKLAPDLPTLYFPDSYSKHNFFAPYLFIEVFY